MKGILGELAGIPVFEDENIREGTYTCLDENNLPINMNNIKKSKVSKILVKNYKTFKIAMKHNEESKQ